MSLELGKLYFYIADNARLAFENAREYVQPFLDGALNWDDYGSKTCPSMAMRGNAELLRAIFEMDGDKKIRNRIAAAGMGTEVIMTLRKKTGPA